MNKSQYMTRYTIIWYYEYYIIYILCNHIMHNDMISESIDPQNGIIQVFEFQLKVFNELKVKALK